MMTGERLAHFKILEKLGAGGMGDVYRATDTTLGREVAIKVLPPSLALSGELQARFEREARALAAVDHPNIAAVHSFETALVEGHSSDDARHIQFLVMQLVDGQSLDELLSRGPLSIDRALDLGGQIASALETAHARGIVHRDLKPGNVQVDSSGSAKVLDFGLAKFLRPMESERQSSMGRGRPERTPFDSSTIELSRLAPSSDPEVTKKGMLLGTAAYMSPEQARGQPADERSDIWAFGCVLYEMLTGARPFGGATLSDCIAQVLERDPDLGELPSGTPPPIKTLIGFCLAKDPRNRLQHMGDVRLWLDRWDELAPASSSSGRSIWVGAALSVLTVSAVLIALWALQRPPGPRPPSVARFSISTEPLALGPAPLGPLVALSPDGRMLAYIAGEGDRGQLYLRSIDSFESEPVSGAERATAPFFSPDSQWIGFETDQRLMRAPVGGGKSRVICDVPNFTGAVWTPLGVVFGSPLQIASLDQEDVRLLDGPPTSTEAAWMAFPEILPDGRSLIFTALDTSGYGTAIEWLDLESSETRTLLGEGGNARYLSTGHLAFVQDGSMMVVPFDADQREVTGRPTPAFDGLLMGFPWAPALAHFTISRDGTLVYVAGPILAVGSQLVRIDRAGTVTEIGESQRNIRGPRFSPDGSRAVVAAEVQGAPSQLWVHDLVRGGFTRLTSEGEAWWPLWTPDGRHIAFTHVSEDGTDPGIFRIPADGSAAAERLTNNSKIENVTSYSSDGQTMILHETTYSGTEWDVLKLDLESPGAEPRPLLAAPFLELLGTVSSDGDWLAYVSNETGRSEVYVRPYPELDRKWQISIDGGTEPVWSKDSRAIYYRDLTGGRILEVRLELQPEFLPGPPSVIVEGTFVPTVGFGRNYDVAPDGQSFLVVRQDLEGMADVSLEVVLNWDAEITSLFAESSP